MTIFNGLGTGGIIVIVLVVIIIIIVAWYIAVLNNIRKMNIKIDEADSNIDVALTKRYDLLTKLFQATKGYMNHEKETLEKVVAMRQPKGNADIHDKEAFANEVGRGLQAINVVVEQYPDLKASQNIIELQRATTDVEENLQASDAFTILMYQFTINILLSSQIQLLLVVNMANVNSSKLKTLNVKM